MRGRAAAQRALVARWRLPAARVLRIDGGTPARARAAVAARFNRDASVAVLLLTTRVGGLGLPL